MLVVSANGDPQCHSYCKQFAAVLAVWLDDNGIIIVIIIVIIIIMTMIMILIMITFVMIKIKQRAIAAAMIIM